MVYVLGGWQSDFARNWDRQGLDIAGAFAETVNAGLEATQLDAADVETGHVGNFVSDLFARQGFRFILRPVGRVAAPHGQRPPPL